MTKRCAFCGAEIDERYLVVRQCETNDTVHYCREIYVCPSCAVSLVGQMPLVGVVEVVNEQPAVPIKDPGITPDEYQAQARTTFLLTDDPNALTYLSLGLANEGGEAAGVMKKWLRGDYDLEETKKRMKGELGDVLWYVAVLADELGLSLADIMSSNIEKLSSRQKRGVLQGDGDDR